MWLEQFPVDFLKQIYTLFFIFIWELWSTEICRRLQRPSVRVNSPLHLPMFFHPPAECPPQLISPVRHLLCTHSFAKNSFLPNHKISIVIPLFMQRIFLNSLIEKMPQFIMTISFRRGIACYVRAPERSPGVGKQPVEGPT